MFHLLEDKQKFECWGMISIIYIAFSSTYNYLLALFSASFQVQKHAKIQEVIKNNKLQSVHTFLQFRARRPKVLL
jgi:hypothetical protein